LILGAATVSRRLHVVHRSPHIARMGLTTADQIHPVCLVRSVIDETIVSDSAQGRKRFAT
jgi:hypothetical protein